MDATLFQYCQKLVIFSENGDSVLLAKRKGEADFDGFFSFVGGKMETTDRGIANSLRREKNEEIGEDAKIDVYTPISFNEYYIKANGQAMILPHLYAVYRGGKIVLNEEYSEYAWVKLAELNDFEPKIDTILPIVKNMLTIQNTVDSSLFVRI